MSEKKYRSIKLEEVREGDEVFSITKGWVPVTSVSHIFYITKYKGFNHAFRVDGKVFDTDIAPELIEARREIKVVTREMWGLGRTTNGKLDPNSVGYVRFKSKSDAEQYANDFKHESHKTPVFLIWEEEEPCQQ